jgi:hypothetical protein
MQLYTRYLRGESRDPRMVAIGERAPRLARKAALLVPGVDFVDIGR